MRRLHSGLILAMLAALVAANTWPQVTHLRAVNDFGDPLLNTWTLAWVAHALPFHPAQLFDANIFHPELHTLAYSETLIVPGLLVSPFLWMGGDPVVAHNFLMLFGGVASGLAMFWLVRALLDHDGAALVAAAIFALLPCRMEEYGHLQLQVTFLLPLILLAAHRLGTTRSSGRAIGLGVLMALQAYTCVYYLIYGVVVLTAVSVARLVTVRLAAWRGISTNAAIAAFTAVLLCAPIGFAYRSAARVVGERSMAEVQGFSATLDEYVRPTAQSALYATATGSSTARRGVFTGYTTFALAAAAFVPPFTPLAASYALAAAVSVDLSLGANGIGYGWLYRWVAPFRALRVPARFEMLVGLSLAVLAGIGVRQLCQGRSAALQTVMVAAAVGLVALETSNRPLDLSDAGERTPSVYTWLAAQPPGVVCEYPVGDLEGRVGPQDPAYMYYSTAHWHPLVNGYSGFQPASYVELKDRLAAFPDDVSIDYLRSRHVAYLLVHSAFYIRGNYAADVAALRARPDLKWTGNFSWKNGQRTAVFRIIG